MEILNDEILCDHYGWLPSEVNNMDAEELDKIRAVLKGRQNRDNPEGSTLRRKMRHG